MNFEAFSDAVVLVSRPKGEVEIGFCVRREAKIKFSLAASDVASKTKKNPLILIGMLIYIFKQT